VDAASPDSQFGPLEPIGGFLLDDTVTEIMVNGPDAVYVERGGTLQYTGRKFDDENHLLRVIDAIVSAVGRRVDFATPLVDARLSDGSRVSAAIPPVAVDGPMLTIRKFARNPYQIEDLIQFGTLSGEAAGFLQACVLARANVLISGGSGTGKTTLLNVCSSFISSGERIVTVEDAAELRLHQEHVCRLEARPPDPHGLHAVTIRDLVIHALRVRPDRILVGEVRGAEALDMLQAMNSGHDGSLSTIHANGARGALLRLETQVLMAGIDLPHKAVRHQIAAAINVVVQLARLQDGRRRVVSISEITGMEEEVIAMQDIFLSEMETVAGNEVMGPLRATGIRPRVMDKVMTLGLNVPAIAHLFPHQHAVPGKSAHPHVWSRHGHD
jgi:pilus assembly protein CpaF